MTNVKNYLFKTIIKGKRLRLLWFILLRFIIIHVVQFTCSGRYHQRSGLGGGGAAPQPPLFLMANNFLKFTYKELDYYGVAPPPSTF